MRDIILTAWTRELYAEELEVRLHTNVSIDGEASDTYGSSIMSIYTPSNGQMGLRSFYPFGTRPHVPLREGLGSTVLLTYLMWAQHHGPETVSFVSPISVPARAMLRAWRIEDPCVPRNLESTIADGSGYLESKLGSFEPFPIEHTS